MLAIPFVLLLVAAPLPAQQSGMTGREIVDHVDRLLRGKSSEGEVRMDVVTERWNRTLLMDVWSLGTDYALIRILEPRKEAGTATLMSKKEIWNYLPHVDRTIRIPTSLMSASWMGSHFTNDDLVKESRLIEDYDISIAYEGPRDGVEVWELDLVPKPEAAVVWGKIVYRVRKSDMMPLWAKYYDEDGELQRTLTFSDFRTMGGRLVPAVMTMRPEDKPDEYTRLTYLELKFDVDLSPDFFSLRRLRASS